MKDPLQPGSTPYETLGVSAVATAEEIDQAFRARLAGHGQIQKLTAARRAVQDPAERALVDLFLLNDATLRTLSPNTVTQTAALMPPQRWATARAWDAELRARFPDPDLLQTMGVIWYWSGLHCEGAGRNDAADAPPLREQWERAIACWSALAGNDQYWRRFPSAPDLRTTVIERLRSRLQDCEQPYRDRGDSAGAELYQELEEALDTELLTAGRPAATGPGRVAGGQLMQRFIVGATSVAGQVPRSGSESARVRTLLNRGNPQAALQAFAAVPEAERRSDEGCALAADVYLALGRELASLDRPDEALAAWEQALAFGETPSEREIQREVAQFCQTRAAALQRSNRPQALRFLERGLKLAPVEKLRQTLAELVTQDGIERINTAFDAAMQSGNVTPDAVDSLERGRRELERAAALGSQRAADQLPAAAALLVRLRWHRRVVKSIDFNDLPRSARERLAACIRTARAPAPIHSQLTPAAKSSGVGLAAAAIAMVALVGVVAVAWGENAPGGSHSVNVLMAAYLPLFFVAIFGVAWTLKQRAASKTLPFRAGQYPFPAVFIDARSRMLRVLPFLRLKKIEPEGTPYGIKINLVVDDQETQSLPIYFRETAKAIFDKLDEGSNAEQAALRTGNFEALAELDPLGDLYGATPVPPDSPADANVCVVRPVPDYFRWSLPVAIAAALVLAVPVWAIRNYTSDTQRFSMAQLIGSEQAWLSYLAFGGRFEDEARAALPPAALAEARKAGTVVALREMMKRYPKTPAAGEARSAVSAIYKETFERFRQLTPGADARILPFMQRLLAYLEAREQTHVAVRFLPPTVAAAVTAELGESSAVTREKSVFDQLGAAFTKIFRADVLQLEYLGRVIDLPKARGEGPLMLIQYDIRTEGSYLLEASLGLPGRQFSGIRVAFGVTLTTPDARDELSFPLTVRPPSRFMVSTTSKYLDPSSFSVYDTMAARAFDQLNDKLQEVFFGVAAGKTP